MAALCYIKKEWALLLSSASFMGRRQTRCSCPQFLHLKLGAGTAWQKKLNVMKCVPAPSRGLCLLCDILVSCTRFSSSSAGGAEPFLGWFSTLCPTAEELCLLSRGFLSCRHFPAQGTDRNIYFNPGLLSGEGILVWDTSKSREQLEVFSPRWLTLSCIFTWMIHLVLALHSSSGTAGHQSCVWDCPEPRLCSLGRAELHS